MFVLKKCRETEKTHIVAEPWLNKSSKFLIKNLKIYFFPEQSLHRYINSYLCAHILVGLHLSTFLWRSSNSLFRRICLAIREISHFPLFSESDIQMRSWLFACDFDDRREWNTSHLDLYKLHFFSSSAIYFSFPYIF